MTLPILVQGKAMRYPLLIVLSILSAGVTGAHAQGAPPSSAPPRRAGALDTTKQQHPEWFREEYKYRQCPSEVEFPNGRQAYLGAR